jgi:hypothetical protein
MTRFADARKERRPDGPQGRLRLPLALVMQGISGKSAFARQTDDRSPPGARPPLLSNRSGMMEKAEDITFIDDSSEPEPVRPSLLLQLHPDRRRGHEWDDWDGLPLPDGGEFTDGPGLYFGVMAGVAWLCALIAALTIWVVEPRLEALHHGLPGALLGITAAALLVSLIWLMLLATSIRFQRPLLPRWLAERGPLPSSMRMAEKVGALLGLSRDRVGSSALQVFNRIALPRSGTHRADELLLLLPRCLSRDSMRAAIDLSVRYGVPAFVASRGRYARQMIRERKPSGVVAVACERDLVSGIADVGGRLPVLGSTIRMPSGPCRDTELNTVALERQLQVLLEGGMKERARGREG